ncbi:hypothetical protein J4416_02050 [Candidatus Pacearchaeota archaeon]|nr:hypothetical protein [Candidatus Pacearchaeota archaeon]
MNLYQGTPNKRAQAWGFDLMIASTIFISGILLFYVYSINYPRESYEKLDKLFIEGDFISEVLLGEGLPVNWDQNSVSRIGITTDKKINETKLESFYLLANNQTNPLGYKKSKSLLNTNYNFFMNFSEPIIIEEVAIPEGGIGQNFQGYPVTNLVKITRVTIYQNKLVSLNLYLWE